MSRTRGYFRERRFVQTQPMPVRRLASMILMLAVVAMLYSTARKPQTWRWLAAGEHDAGPIAAADIGAPAAAKAEPEIIVPGPTDEDPAEWADAQKLFDLVVDKVPEVDPLEMPAYWRCLRWARAQTFDEMQRRATKGVEYVKFVKEPEKYRGKLIRLRLRVMRVVQWDAQENAAEITKVTEAWGPNDQSQSFLYATATGDWPSELKVGLNVDEQAEFVGYFLKLLVYEGADGKKNPAPLLLGRIKPVASRGARQVANGPLETLWPWVAGAGVLLIVAVVLWKRYASPSAGPLPVTRPPDEATMEGWFQGEPGPEAPTADSRSARNLPELE